MRNFRAKAGCTIWGDFGYEPVPRGTMVKVAMSKAGALAVPATVNGKRGMIALEDLVGWPLFTQGGKAFSVRSVALAPEVASDTAPSRSAPQNGRHAGGAE